jgi:hypothetical protein
MSFVTAVPETLAVCAIHGKCGSRVGDSQRIGGYGSREHGFRGPT